MGLVLRIRKSEASDGRGWRESIETGDAKYAIPPQTGQNQVAPLGVAAAGAGRSCYGRLMSLRRPF